MRVSLSNKFIAITVLIVLLALGVSSYFKIKGEQELLIAQLISKGESLGRFTALISPEAVLSYDFVELDTIIAEISKDPDVLYAVIESSEGDALTTYRPTVSENNELQTLIHVPLSSEQLKEQFDEATDNLVVLHFPIIFEGRKIANFTLGLNKRVVHKASEKSIKNNIIELAIIIPILISTLYFAFRILAVNPINHLVLAIRSVAKGKYNKQVNIRYQDEIGDLGSAYNTMSQNLHDLREENIKVNDELKFKARDLVKFNEQLEALVKVRTHDLEIKAEKLARSNAELDKFAYVTSHDLKAPLRAIASLSEWIEEDLEDVINKETRKHLKILRSRVHRLESLINSILKYSRAGRIDMDLERVNVAELVVELVNALHLPDTVTVDVEHDMPNILTARVPLSQVFSNLISNAITHHDRQKCHIRIYCLRDKDQTNEFYRFVVADDGPGIEPQYYDKVFELFQTLRARDEFESTGIGLSLVKRIIVELGGDITISAAQNRGTQFNFTLPKS